MIDPPTGFGDQRRRSSALWLWSSEEAGRALRTRDLAVILRTYRRLNGLSQERLARRLGYDKTYISMMETGRRIIRDVETLRHVAHSLAIPTHVLGVTEVDDVTFVAMLQFAGSVLTLAEIARESGRAVDAVNELWPVVARLEARATERLMERDSLALLARTRLSLGVALGEILPDEKLSTAAKWTGQAMIVAERIEDQSFLAHTLSMHGNELRKAGRVGAAIERIRRSIELSPDAPSQASAYALLARAAGEIGHPDLFDTAMAGYRRHLDKADGSGMLSNQFTFREVQLRGLVATGRASTAARLINESSRPAAPFAPQWGVIERVTAGEVLLTNGERSGAEEALLTALAGAETYRLPHQAQRVIRVAATHDVDDIAHAARNVLSRISGRLDMPGR